MTDIAQALIAELEREVERLQPLVEALETIKSHNGDDAYHTAIATKALAEFKGEAE